MNTSCSLWWVIIETMMAIQPERLGGPWWHKGAQEACHRNMETTSGETNRSAPIWSNAQNDKYWSALGNSYGLWNELRGIFGVCTALAWVKSKPIRQWLMIRTEEPLIVTAEDHCVRSWQQTDYINVAPHTFYRYESHGLAFDRLPMYYRGRIAVATSTL